MYHTYRECVRSGGRESVVDYLLPNHQWECLCLSDDTTHVLPSFFWSINETSFKKFLFLHRLCVSSVDQWTRHKILPTRRRQKSPETWHRAVRCRPLSVPFCARLDWSFWAAPFPFCKTYHPNCYDSVLWTDVVVEQAVMSIVVEELWWRRRASSSSSSLRWRKIRMDLSLSLEGLPFRMQWWFRLRTSKRVNSSALFPPIRLFSLSLFVVSLCCGVLMMMMSRAVLASSVGSLLFERWRER